VPLKSIAIGLASSGKKDGLRVIFARSVSSGRISFKYRNCLALVISLQLHQPSLFFITVVAQKD
jgi:hypothetical protein